jgi:hypothetical protein
MRPRIVWSAALAAALVASAAHALPRIELGLGATASSSDGPQESGASATLAALWEIGPRFEFGPMLFADDLGSTLGRLRDANDPSIDLGPIAERHRMTFGGAWRVDALLRSRGRWNGRAGATWGYYRIHEDRIGVVQQALSAVGWSLGAGASRTLWPSTALGISVRWHQLLEERQDHYVRATVDLMWLPVASTASASPTPSNEN